MKNYPEWIPLRILVLAVLMLPAGAAAQLRRDVLFTAAPVHAEMARMQEPQADAGSQMTTSGFFLGVVGMLGGAAVGSGVGNARCGTDCVGRSAFGRRNHRGLRSWCRSVCTSQRRSPVTCSCRWLHPWRRDHWCGRVSTRFRAGRSRWRRLLRRLFRSGLR